MEQAKDIEEDYEEDDEEDDEEDEEGEEENITLQCDQNFSDVELLDILKTALSQEAKESDVNKFGSIIMNLILGIVQHKINFDELGFKIAASFFRRRVLWSSRMRYTADEKLFWNFVSLCHGDGVLRTLRGKANQGTNKLGTQPSEECMINIAIPSKFTRKKVRLYICLYLFLFIFPRDLYSVFFLKLLLIL